MFADWYFCCCIDASPRKTLAFLAILETLRNPESDSQLLALTYDELRRTDVWMQIYALSSVLESLQYTDFPVDVRERARAYVNELLDLFPETRELRRTYSDLLGVMLSGRNPPIALMNLCATLTSEDQSRHTTPTPYLDLKEFLPETLLLCVLANQLAHTRVDKASRQRLLHEMQTASSLNRLVQRGLDQQLGRLAFCFAVRIAFLASIQSDRKELLKMICMVGQDATALEPDLLRVAAEVIFGEITIDTIIRETHTFEILDQEIIPRQGIKNAATQLRRVGWTIWTGDVPRTLSLIYWQVTLWELAAEFDAIKTATYLARLWRLPEIDLVRREIPIGGPDREITRRWEGHLNDLLLIQDYGRIEVRPLYTKSSEIPDDQCWLFCSPWLRLDSRSMLPPWKQRNIVESATNLAGVPLAEQPTRIPRYPAALKPLAMIRLIGATTTAIQLLQLLSHDDPHRIDLAQLVVHAADVLLRIYDYWLKNFDRPTLRSDAWTLTQPLTGLVLFGRRQIDMAGRGYLQTISPEDFSRIRSEQPSAAERAKQRRDDRSYFLDAILPDIMIEWITAAYTGAIGSSGQRRWLELIPRVYQYHRLYRDRERSRRWEAALVMRFLRQTSDDFDVGEFDWRKYHNEQRTDWVVPSNQMLLTRKLLASDWLGGWDEPDWKTLPISFRQTPLVRAIERLAALDDDQTLPEETRASWRREWIEHLNAVDKTEGMNRFIRLRLLEMLDHPVLADFLEGQELIALVLLEYGTVYELKQMFDRVFVLDDAQRAAEATGVRQTLRVTLLRAMWRELELVPDLRHSQSNPRDPRLVVINARRLDFIREQMARIAFASTSGEAPYHLLKRVLNELSVGALERQTWQTLRVLLAQQEQHDHKTYLMLSPEERQVFEWSVHIAVYDPNMLTNMLFVQDTIVDRTTNLRNLFRMTDAEITAFLERRTTEAIYVLAVLVDAQHAPTGVVTYVFNYGAREYIQYISPQPLRDAEGESIAMGMFVALPIRQVSPGSWEVAVTATMPIRVEHSLPAGNIVARLTWAEYWDNHVDRREFRLLDSDMRPISYDDNIWNPDLSRIFWQPEPNVENQLENQRVTIQPESVYARRVDGHLRPVDRTFLNLLMTGCTYAGSTVAVLTLIEEFRDLSGKLAWRFAGQPGYCYVLYQHDFLPNDALVLESQIQNLAHHIGLLVTVMPVQYDLGMRLSLVHHSIQDNALERRYPDLIVPFDKRNLDWRGLFQRTDAQIARSEGQSWYIDLNTPIAGFPRRLRVDWEVDLPPTGMQTVPIAVHGGDCRQATISGEPLLYKIVPHDNDWRGFLDRWLNLALGDRLTITRPIGGLGEGKLGDDGVIRHLTDENVSVLVEAESLSMNFMGAQAVHGRWPREAEVVEIDWSRERRLRIDAAVVLAEAIVNEQDREQYRGIVTQIPHQTGHGEAECIVVWDTGMQVMEMPLKIENFAQVGIFQGCQIVGERRGNEWIFSIYSPKIVVRALWSIVERRALRRDQAELIFLGHALYGKEQFAVAQARPGELILLPSSSSDSRHLSHITMSGERIIRDDGGLRPEWQVTNLGNMRDRTEGDFTYRRAFLRIHGSSHILTGVCRSSGPNGRQDGIGIAEVTIRLEQRPGGLIALRREFRLDWMRKAPLSKPVSAPSTRIDQWREQLANYLEDPKDIDATYDDHVIRLETMRVPANNNDPRGTYEVALGHNEGPFVTVDAYPVEARVRLFQDDQGNIFASFRRVRSDTPKDFMVRFGVTFNEWLDSMLDDVQLYYARSELFDVIKGEPYPERYHRFEWGYGWTLLVPESQLRFRGRAFNEAELMLFHGDRITSMMFLHPETEDESAGDEVSRPECIVDIASVQFSQERELYQQRHNYQFIHILSLIAHPVANGEMDIFVQHIEGIETRHISAVTRRYDRVRVVLSQASLERLRRRLHTVGKAQEPVPMTILGRLDEERFRQTEGKEIAFEHVRMSFMASPAGPPLQSGELVVLRADRIVQWTNETALQLRALGSLSQEDIGADFASLTNPVCLIRSNFSERKEMLTRILKARGPSNTGLNRLLLVRLTHKNGEVQPSMLSNLPARSVEVLVGMAIAQTPLLAVVTRGYIPDEDGTQRGLRLELKPGVFVNLKRSQFEASTEDIEEAGTIVRVIYIKQQHDANHRFRITRAIFADMRYVPVETRHAVALPKNNLLAPAAPKEPGIATSWFWKARNFTIGDLPQVEPMPGSYDPRTGRWSQPQISDLLSLMKTRHPKIVRLGRYRDQVSLGPAALNVPVGSLSGDSLSVPLKYVPLSQAPGAPEAQHLYWPFLTFGDESAIRVIERARQETWRYHDTRTGHWNESGVVELQDLGSHDIWSGPLFFQVDPDQYLRLRYNRNLFLKYGFPVSALIQSLEAKGGERAWYPVAGTSNADGLWVELTPGRIVEIPAQLIVRELRGKRTSLASINWSLFAAGDQVALRLLADEDFDWIVLEEWRSGPRGAFGPRCCFLPVLSCNEQEGALELGSGAYRLTLPVAARDTALRCIALFPDNHMQDAATLMPESDDVILLGINEAGDIIVLGFPDLIPRPERKNERSWQDDPLDYIFLGSPEAIRELIEISGGALPVTVEFVYHPHKTLFFSRRYQRVVSQWVPHSLAPLGALGLIHRRGALLRCGGGLVIAPVDQIISGLPEHLFGPAMHALGSANIEVWRRTNQVGETSFGIQPEGVDNFLVEAVEVISTSDNVPEGLICRSVNTLALYWLPAAFIAWTKLTTDQLTRIFCGATRRVFEVQRVLDESGATFISAVDVPVALREFRNLDVERELITRLVQPIDIDARANTPRVPRRYLVESFTTHILLECEVYDDVDLPRDEPIPVEVVRRVLGSPNTITVAPVGKKLLTLDLPSSMVAEWDRVEPTSDREAGLLRTPFDNIPDSLEVLSDAQLAEYLHGLFDAGDFATGARVSAEWQRRNQHMPEMDLTLAIKAVRCLYESGDNRSYQLLQNLTSRALRSRHVEILAREWFGNSTYRNRRDGLWERLQQSMNNLRPPLTVEKIEAIRKFCHVVNVRVHRDSTVANDDGLLLVITDALQAATGSLREPLLLDKRAEITDLLRILYKTVPVTPGADGSHLPGLHEAHIRILDRILGLINEFELGLTLLEPLSTLTWKNR